MTPARRKLILFTLLAGSALAVTWDRMRSRTVVVGNAVVRQPARHTTEGAVPAPAAQTLGELKPRTDYLTDGANAFPALHPPVPPGPAAPLLVTEAPRPSAPALPFTVLGKKLERGIWEVYLAKGDQTYVATQGVVVADAYRVNVIGPTQMTLIYLPLNEQQILQTGASLND
ncbi:MAG: hypothetical protein JF606_11215 [Burkholderiales bacterium]|nr:hypothetical protein [Burkholderiales bacterium]